jgi:hypothetical protein
MRIRLQALLVCAAAATAVPVDRCAAQTDADYTEIYRLVLDSIGHHGHGELKHAFIQSDAQRPFVMGNDRERSVARFLEHSLEDTRPETIRAFQAVFDQPADVRALLALPDREWKSRAEIEQLHNWKGPPHDLGLFSVTAFSPIGMSPDGSQAVVYISYWCGALCSDGQYVLLERAESGWRIADVALAWAS